MEVILTETLLQGDCLNFLHVCGGDPKSPLFLKNINQFSPRMWRWSASKRRKFCSRNIFSTYVEVILAKKQNQPKLKHFLHVCGGDPTFGYVHIYNPLFSPRMWRWSHLLSQWTTILHIFSTYVEVILHLRLQTKVQKHFLHVCGGDPMDSMGEVV